MAIKEDAVWRVQKFTEDMVGNDFMFIPKLIENLRAALAAADAEKYDECKWQAFTGVFNRSVLNDPPTSFENCVFSPNSD